MPAPDIEKLARTFRKTLDDAPPTWDCVSRGYVSLWDMADFSVHSFLWAVHLVDQEAGCCALMAQQNANATFPPEWDERFLKNLRFICEKCDQIESTSGRDQSENIANMARQRMPLAVINNNLHTLKTIIGNDVNRRMFRYIPQEMRKAIIEMPARWGTTWKKFPSVQKDCEQAAEAYAHELYNACVFHMMMILERGLASLADKLHVERGKKDWARLIERIRSAIEAYAEEGAKTPKGSKPLSPSAARKRAEVVTFYSEAAKEFTYFKDAWRNHVAHGRAKYEKHDAAKVMDHVCYFMEHLAERLSEPRR